MLMQVLYSFSNVLDDKVRNQILYPSNFQSLEYKNLKRQFNNTGKSEGHLEVSGSRERHGHHVVQKEQIEHNDNSPRKVLHRPCHNTDMTEIFLRL